MLHNFNHIEIGVHPRGLLKDAYYRNGVHRTFAVHLQVLK